jgi:hypothetical protein
VTTPVPANTSLPTIKNPGSPTVGTKMGSDQGRWTGNPTSYQIQWLRCDGSGNNCNATTAYRNTASYTPVAADGGHTLRARWIATNSAGDSAPATSAATAVVTSPAPTNISPPTIKNANTLTVGTKTGADQGRWTGSPTSYQIQWIRCDADGSSNCNPVTPYRTNVGTYRLVQDDAGHTLKVRMIATNSGGDSAPATSAASGVVN